MVSNKVIDVLCFFRVVPSSFSKYHKHCPLKHTRDMDQIGSTSIRILLDPVLEIAIRLHFGGGGVTKPSFGRGRAILVQNLDPQFRTCLEKCDP